MLRIALLALVCASLARAAAPADEVRDRFIYCTTNFDHEENLPPLFAILERAAKAGYTGIVIGDCKFTRVELTDKPSYVANLQRFRDKCRELKLRIVAQVFDQTLDLLSNDPNLAEGSPVVDAPFVATMGRLVPDDRDFAIENGSFEELDGDHPRGWRLDGGASVDRAVALRGAASLRLAGFADAPGHRVRARQRVACKPFRAYRLSAKVRTDAYAGGPWSVGLHLIGAHGRSLVERPLPVAATGDWREIGVVFNTFDSDAVDVEIGCWDAAGGTIWFDDVRVEPYGFVNLIRRPSCPVTIRSLDGATTYEEGRDVADLKDPLLGHTKWWGYYEPWYAQPVVRVPDGSRIAEGQTVLLSYFHAQIADEKEFCFACLEEPAIWTLHEKYIARLKEVLAPDAYFLTHDEYRHQGWDPSCRNSGHTPAQTLAENVRRCTRLLQRLDPGKPMYIWSDLFDPFHNAGDGGRPYYLVAGLDPWHGSWEGLDPAVTVVNWNGGEHRLDSLKFFAGRGHHQIMSVYTDPGVDGALGWLQAGAQVEHVDGVMFTTWANNYSGIEALSQRLDAFAAGR